MPFDQNRSIEVTVESSRGAIAAVVHLPAKVPAPVVICCHGLWSSKDSSKFTAIAEALSDAGLVGVRFDFSDCGETRAQTGPSLIGARLGDLQAVMNHAAGEPWSRGPLALLGSSLGGYIALLAAASEPERVRAVVTWATPFDLEKLRERLGESRELESRFPKGFELGEPQSLGSLPPLPRVLIIQGRQDETVPWRDAEAIYRTVGDPRRLMLVQTADHRFLDPSCRKMAIRASIDWFHEQGLTAGIP